MPSASNAEPPQDRNQEFVQQLEVEFRDSASDMLERVEEVLSAGRESGSIGTSERDGIYRAAHSIKGLAAGIGRNLTSVVAHRFEDYLAEIKEPTAANIEDMQKFVDALNDLVDGTVTESRVNGAEFVRRLPSRPVADFGDVVVQEIEVFVIMPDDAVSRHVMRELQACGYRVTREGNSFRAIEIAAMTRPDLVIATGVLDMLSGVDLISALRAMPATRDIPVALITSATREEMMAGGLPEAVPVIHKGADFGDDLTDALTELGIL